jgi:CRISPR-associated protein Cmr6
MKTRRDRLERISISANVNASLWLDKFIKEQETQNQQRDNAQGTPKQSLVNEVADIGTPQVYEQFFWRWKQTLKDSGAQMQTLKVDGRMIVGLGAESVLETSITLHKTYGVPYIPGSALKGLVAFYIRQELDENLWRKDSPAYQTIFGSQVSAGYITFHDALYVPSNANKPLHADILTVHHQDYYQGTSAPADWDNPVPVPLLSATGDYLVALSGVAGAAIWIEKTFEILSKALSEYGIGAKTSSGYGRATLVAEVILSEAEKQEKEERKKDRRLDSFMERLEKAQTNNKDAKKEFREMVKSLRKLEPEQKRSGAQAMLDKVESLGMKDELITNKAEWYDEAKRMAAEK